MGPERLGKQAYAISCPKYVTRTYDRDALHRKEKLMNVKRYGCTIGEDGQGFLVLASDYDALAAKAAAEVAKWQNSAVEDQARIHALEADKKHLYEWGRKLEMDNKKLRDDLATEIVYGPDRSDQTKARIAQLEAALREAMEWNWIEDASLDGGIPESVVKQCNDALGASEPETKGEQGEL
jgi:hypothetical protein